MADAVVAIRIGFLLPGCLYLYYSGFDPAWGRYNVATTIVAEAIRYAIGLGLPRLHLSMGVDASKERWGPFTSVRHRATAVRAGGRARVAHGLYAAARSGSPFVQALDGLLPRRRVD